MVGRVEAGLNLPDSRPAMVDTILKVLAGGNPWKARLSMGAAGRLRSFHWAVEGPLANTLGSKVGRLAMARIAPVWGSRATIAPLATVLRARSAAR